MSAEGGGGRFAWLLDKTNRRADLRAVRMALDAGRLDAEARIDLADVLARLVASATFSAREHARVEDLYRAIAECDRRDPAHRPVRLARARERRPPNPF